MTIKTAGMTICVAVAVATAGWGQNSKAQKFHTSLSTPHHPVKEVGAPKRHSSDATVVSTRTQTSRQSELSRLEKQNSTHLQSQARQHSTPKTQVAKVRPAPAGHSDNINFSYHPPHNQSAGTGTHKH